MKTDAQMRESHKALIEVRGFGVFRRTLREGFERPVHGAFRLAGQLGSGAQHALAAMPQLVL